MTNVLIASETGLGAKGFEGNIADYVLTAIQNVLQDAELADFLGQFLSKLGGQYT